MRAQRGEQLVELLLRDMVRRPAGKPGPVPPRTLAAVGLHRVVVRMRTPAPPPGQRERVDDRAGPGFAMEVVKAAQNALAMRDRGQRVTAARRRLPGHRVGHPSPDHGGGRATRLARIAWIARATGLDGDLDPSAEVPGLGPGRLIPRHPGRPQEPEPAQQRDRIRAQRGLRPARRLQISQERRNRTNQRPGRIAQPARLPRILRPLQPPRLRDDQGRQIPRLVMSGHEQRP